MHCGLHEIASRAAGLHLGLDVALEMLDFFDDLGRFDKLDSGTWFVRNRHMIWRASKINRERWTVEILAFCRVVNEVENHPRALHERQAKDSVDGDVGTRCDQERCVLPLGCLVGEVESEALLKS